MEHYSGIKMMKFYHFLKIMDEPEEYYAKWNKPGVASPHSWMGYKNVGS
jgi:hypothetical protein